MKLQFFLIFIICCCCAPVFAQTRTVQGFVVDQESKVRIARVYIYNLRSEEGIYNNNKGEFLISAKLGDTILSSLSGYTSDTLVYKGQAAIIFQLRSLSIKLKEVQILGKAQTPAEQYSQKLREYRYALARGSSKDLLNLSGRGVGLGIDAIYNLLSREGKNARHLQTILERDYRESLIDYRFNIDYVRSITSATDNELNDFMPQYRPTYQFTLTASDYAFAQFVRNSFASYKRNPAIFRLPKLPSTSFKSQ